MKILIDQRVQENFYNCNNNFVLSQYNLLSGFGMDSIVSAHFQVFHFRKEDISFGTSLPGQKISVNP